VTPSKYREIKGKNPVRIILDRNFKTNFDYNVYKNDNTRVILITKKKIKAPKNVEIIDFKDFDTLLKDLYKMGIYSLMVEAGGTLNSKLIEAGEVDFIHHFIAPKILGDGISFVNDFNIKDINNAIKLETEEIKIFNDDILINSKFIK